MARKIQNHRKKALKRFYEYITRNPSSFIAQRCKKMVSKKSNTIKFRGKTFVLHIMEKKFRDDL